MPTDLLARTEDPPLAGDELLAVARLLDTPAGRRLRAHLERRFLAQVLPPTASDAELRHREGQRSVVLYLNHLVAAARRGAPGDLA